MSGHANEGHRARAHPVLPLRPPGSGKTMLAKRLPTILPPPTLADADDISAEHVAEAIHYRRLDRQL